MEGLDMHEKRWTGEERRSDSVTVDRVALMIEEAVEERISKMEDKMLAHMDVKFGQLHKTFSDAFPGGDPHGHRMAHEKQIRDADGWARMKAEVVSKFLSGGLWVAAGWLGFAVWQAFKESVHK